MRWPVIGDDIGDGVDGGSAVGCGIGGGICDGVGVGSAVGCGNGDGIGDIGSSDVLVVDLCCYEEAT